MAGRHRKLSRRYTPAARRWAPSLAAAAVSATSVTTALVTGTTASITVLPVELAALITPANSTAQIIAGSTYYGVDWPTQGYGDPQVVPFFLGSQGIANAINDNKDDQRGVVVLASGWGAGQTGTALALLAGQNNTDALDNIDLVILDNNTNRAGGGFWTTYSVFAPLLGTSAEPTPNNLDVRVVDVAYEYNINSNAATYPLNGLALTNSLVAYLYGYGTQETTELPDGRSVDELESGVHYVVHTDGTVTEYDLGDDVTTTYITYESDGLPLVRPLRAIPGGDIVADAVEPTLTVLVNWGYKDNEPIPEDPTQTRQAGLMPSAAENATALSALPGAVSEGASAVQRDISSNEGGPMPSGSSSVLATRETGTRTGTTDLDVPLLGRPTMPQRGTIDMTGGNLVKPRNTAGADSLSGGGGRPVQPFGGVTKVVSDFAKNAADAVKDVSSAAPRGPGSDTE